MPCYLARPDGDEARPAVIVLQEIFGVNTEVKRISDLLAATGYVALAINYYHRTHPDLNEPYTQEGLQNGFAAAGGVTRATMLADVAAALDYLNKQDFVKFDHVATWGFCFGGSVAFESATLPGLCSAIAFYGGSIAARRRRCDPLPAAARFRRERRLHRRREGRPDQSRADHGRKALPTPGLSRRRPRVLPRFLGRHRLERERRRRLGSRPSLFGGTHRVT